MADQTRSRDFYRAVFGFDPVLDVPGMTEFELGPRLKLGLMPENGIARIVAGPLPHPADGTGIPRCELYLAVDDPDGALRRALGAGAVPVSGLAPRDWGDLAGYVADPDGHVIAFARKY